MKSESVFELRFPYKPLHWVTGLDNDHEFEVEGLICRLRDENPYLVLKIQPFSTEQAAQAFLPRLWGALASVAAELRTGFVVEMQVDSVTYAEDPEKAAANLSRSFDLPDLAPIHGLVNGNMPSVIPVDKNIRTLKMGEITGTVTWAADKYVPALINAMSRIRDGSLYHDEKFRTVIGLFSDLQRESFIRSKFLTCMIALEVLASPLKKHAIAQQLLDELDERVKAIQSGFESNSDEWHALESLQRELLHRREASLRSSIRQLILDGLGDIPLDELRIRSKEVVWAYDIRGNLVHGSAVEPRVLNQAHGIAYQALVDLLRRKIGIT